MIFFSRTQNGKREKDSVHIFGPFQDIRWAFCPIKYMVIFGHTSLGAYSYESERWHFDQVTPQSICARRIHSLQPKKNIIPKYFMTFFSMLLPSVSVTIKSSGSCSRCAEMKTKHYFEIMTDGQSRKISSSNDRGGRALCPVIVWSWVRTCLGKCTQDG